MAINMVYSEEQLHAQISSMLQSCRRNIHICATVIDKNDFEMAIHYVNGSLIDWSIKDSITKCEVGSPRLGHNNQFLNFIIPANLSYEHDSMVIYGYGSRTGVNSVAFFATDFVLGEYTIPYYTDRIQTLNNWGFVTAEVKLFNPTGVIEGIKDLKRALPGSYGLFITKDAQDPGKIEPPFFYKF